VVKMLAKSAFSRVDIEISFTEGKAALGMGEYQLIDFDI